MVHNPDLSGEHFDPGLDDGALLERVLAHYRRSLADTPSAHAWLAERGVSHGEVVAAFGLGLSDRTLGLSLPIGARVAGREPRGRLQALGGVAGVGS